MRVTVIRNFSWPVERTVTVLTPRSEIQHPPEGSNHLAEIINLIILKVLLCHLFI